MSSIFNKGSQIITWDFKNPAKARNFDRVNRNVVKPGIYKGLTINFAGHTVSLTPGNIVINCSFDSLDFLQVKVDFETSYSFSEQIYPSVTGSSEIIYLEYEFAETTENYVDIKHMSSYQYFLSPVKNAVIVGELQFDGSNNIIGISYTNKTWGLLNADIDYSLPDSSTYYFNTITQTKRWRVTGTLFSTGTKELQYMPFNESIGRIVTTSPTNTSMIENKMFISSQEDSTSLSTGALVALGGIAITKNLTLGGDFSTAGKINITNTNDLALSVSGGVGVVKNVDVGDRLSANKFYGRVPLGSVIPILGAFSSSGNNGTFTSAFIPSSGVITDDGFQKCDGTIINNSLSPFNGKYIPDLTDNRFIQGSTSAGELGGNITNTITIGTANLPTHTHDITHTHTQTTGTQSANHTHSGTSDGMAYANAYSAPYIDSGGFGSGAGPYLLSAFNADGIPRGVNLNIQHTHTFSTGGISANHNHTFTTSQQSTSTSGNGGFANTPIDIRPKYINAVYLMRVI